MCFWRLPPLHHINITRRVHKPDIVRAHPAIEFLATRLKEHIHREPDIKRQRRIDLIHLLIRQFNR